MNSKESPLHFIPQTMVLIIRRNTDEYNIESISKCIAKAGKIDIYIIKKPMVLIILSKTHYFSLRKF